MPECFNCGEESNYVVDPLLPDPDNVAYACKKENGGCGTIFKA